MVRRQLGRGDSHSCCRPCHPLRIEWIGTADRGQDQGRVKEGQTVGHRGNSLILSRLIILLDHGGTGRQVTTGRPAPGQHPLRIDAQALVEALEPFSIIAGEMFARNWNTDQPPVIALDNPEGGNRVTVSDFFQARAALDAAKETT